MTKISNFTLNTHFTGLKQLPRIYETTASYGGRTVPSDTIAETLFSTKITVPAGVYVEIVAIQASIDGNEVHLSHSLRHYLNTNSQVYFELTQTNSGEYELAGFITVLDNSPAVLPAGTVKVALALSTAPF